MIEAFVYVVLITLAEVITVNVNLVWGILSHIVLLVAVILHSALVSKQTRQNLLLSLALVPLIRIISLSMPLAGIPQIWWYPIIYIPLLVAAWQVIRLQGYSWEQIGLNFNRIPIQLGITMAGFVFGVLEYLILMEEAKEISLVLQETRLLAAFLLLSTTGFVEELTFRGVLQRNAVEALGRWWGIVYVSLTFAIVHLIHQSLLDVGFVFIIALIFGWVVNKTGSLSGVILSHGITNIVLFLVAPSFF
ncbi:MAG: type II CAAX endopeptidase family protein [Dehalococcoidales bacterium]|nr:type II CAAX endopeptidase family protein [Dehalococcoidales bacterium]